jgi:Zn-dependent M28 family amino/carboxypeptidase
MKEVAEKILNTPFSSLITTAKSSAAIAKVKPGKINFKVVMKTSILESENVLGYLEGTDKKDELVIITAHYDHVGIGEGEGDVIYNGADDDGSGTVAVMELAEAFAEAKRNGKGPRRSMLFMTVTAEELGLFGSEYYVTHPVYPLAKTVANLNIDMIGRSDNQYEGKSDYVYVIGSDKLSKELHTINEQANQQHTKLVFDYTYNDEAHPDRLYYRSDHWNFAKNNIPIIFYFDGIHNDYHQVTDEVSKINFDILAKRTKLVFHTAWEIANREKRLVLDR